MSSGFMLSAPAQSPVRRIVRIAFVISGGMFAFLMYLLYFRTPAAAVPEWTRTLPDWNATFNGVTLALVVLGVTAIRARRRRLHIALMVGALTATVLFLIGYVTWHHYQGDTPYTGGGILRPIYFFVLITHIVAAAVNLPLVITTATLAATRRFRIHRRWARVTVPIWLYASLTGLVVYAMLYG